VRKNIPFLGLEVKLRQKLVITPQLKYSLKLLQMPVTEILVEVNNILTENPVLEELETKQESVNLDSDEFLKVLKKNDWDDYFNNFEDRSFIPLSNNKEINYDSFIGKKETLYENLLFQLKTAGLDQTRVMVGEYIIGNLSDDGYFRMDSKICSEELGVSEDDFNEILSIIQTFDPSGIASRNLKECICNQLIDFVDNVCDIDEIVIILDNFQTDLIEGDYNHVSEQMNISSERFDYLLGLIRKIDPKPGDKYADSNRYAVPDVYVVKNNGEYSVVLNESDMPALKISNYYINLLKNNNLDAKTKEYVEEKVKNALWLVKSLNQRQSSILKVVESIVEFQKDFFKKGYKYLKPLKLKNIAEITDLHESTVSRVTSGKYLFCEYGLIEIKSFFVKGITTVNGDISTNNIKETIELLIKNEYSGNPYSDQKITELLSKKGIKIARRTVAKYRGELNILSRINRKKRGK